MDVKDTAVRGTVTAMNMDAKVWRYMNVAKLISILQSKSLFFARIKTFEDPFEGSIPEAVRNVFGERKEKFGDGEARVVDIIELHGKLSCVNCWHLNEAESAAMWKLYSFDAGVAIQSSIGGLKQALQNTDGLQMALVQYVDFEAAELPTLAHPLYLKRKSFRHENELRLVLFNADLTNYPNGISVYPDDLSKLIEKVYVSPSALSWVAEVIRKELHLYGVSVEVIQSELYSKNAEVDHRRMAGVGVRVG